jgi:hypothetical protein
MWAGFLIIMLLCWSIGSLIGLPRVGLLIGFAWSWFYFIAYGDTLPKPPVKI